MDRFAFVQHLFSSTSGIPRISAHLLCPRVGCRGCELCNEEAAKVPPRMTPLQQDFSKMLRAIITYLIVWSKILALILCLLVRMYPCFHERLDDASSFLKPGGALILVPAQAFGLLWLPSPQETSEGVSACCLTSASKFISFLRFLFGKKVETWSQQTVEASNAAIQQLHLSWEVVAV